MANAEKLRDLIARLISGNDVPASQARLGELGQRGLDVILDLMEDQAVQPPPGRHPRDLYEDVTGALWKIAEVDPEPLITALQRRPAHTFALVWNLGASRQEAALQTLIEYAAHRDPMVRWAAVSGLSGRRRKLVLPTLLRALKDRSNNVSFAALQGLARCADHSAILPLQHYLTSKRLQPGERRIAQELLDKLQTRQR